MTEQNQIPPGGEDLVLDQQLLTLERFTPIIGFENRVLSRVWRPAPMFLLVWKDRIRAFATPRVRWALAGIASLGSLGSTIALAAAFDAFGRGPAQRALASVSGVANNTTWDGIQNAVISWMPTAAGYLNGIPAAPLSEWTNVAIGVAFAPAISLVGLYLVMKRPKSERVRSHAAR